jgi:hypothetical protein
MEKIPRGLASSNALPLILGKRPGHGGKCLWRTCRASAEKFPKNLSSSPRPTSRHPPQTGPWVAGLAGGKRRLRRGTNRPRASGGSCKRRLADTRTRRKPAGVEEVKAPSDPPVRQYDRAACFRRAASGPEMAQEATKVREVRDAGRPKSPRMGRRGTGIKKLGSVTRRPVSFCSLNQRSDARAKDDARPPHEREHAWSSRNSPCPLPIAPGMY